MSGFLDGVLKTGDGSRLAIQRELEFRRDRWDRPGYLYRGGADYMLRHGKFYRGRVCPDAYAHLIGASNECFDNALVAVRQEPSLRYCEGVYSTGHTWFTPHAWCVDPKGELVELTYPTIDREMFTNDLGMPILPPERWGYWGVIFRPELIEDHLELVREHCVFDRPAADRDATNPAIAAGLDMSQDHDFPILKIPYDPDRTTFPR
jgi:hypothetical protein